ncbi:MAG: hypothetical protein IPI65_22130 [Bacteroidetes bacterium]|nr:hypothetical protein [Bacteroidota bacterium]
MLLVGRTWDVNYRYGFNGKEFDTDTYGEGNIYDYGFRVYNPRIGKFLSTDPLSRNYPWYTPYQFAGNKPIVAIDLDGLEEYVVHNIYNGDGILIEIRVFSYSDVNGKAQDMKIYESNPHFQSGHKVAVVKTFEDGTGIGEPTYQDELTTTQSNILKSRQVINRTLSESSNSQSEGDGWNGWKTKNFVSGEFTYSVMQTTITIAPQFERSSDNYKPGEESKVDPLGQILLIAQDATVTLSGNGGTDEGRAREVILGTGPDVMNQPTTLNGKSSTTGGVLIARAERVKNTLVTKYFYRAEQIITQTGYLGGHPTDRTVSAQISIPGSPSPIDISK